MIHCPQCNKRECGRKNFCKEFLLVAYVRLELIRTITVNKILNFLKVLNTYFLEQFPISRTKYRNGLHCVGF